MSGDIWFGASSNDSLTMIVFLLVVSSKDDSPTMVTEALQSLRLYCLPRYTGGPINKEPKVVADEEPKRALREKLERRQHLQGKVVQPLTTLVFEVPSSQKDTEDATYSDGT